MMKSMSLLSSFLVAALVPLAVADYDKWGDLLLLSDDDLFEKGLHGIYDEEGVLQCRIENNIGMGGACDLYVKVYQPIVAMASEHNWPHPPIGFGKNGWPLNTQNRGDGCVRAPDLPKCMTTCYYASPEYDLPADVRESFCTDSGKTNAVAQLRHAIENDQCPFCYECFKG